MRWFKAFLKVNLVTSYYNVINFLILYFTAPVIFTDTLDLCTFNFSLHCKLGESVNLQAVICMAVFGVFLFTVEQLVGNQDNVDWFSNIYNCRFTYCAKQTGANEDREKTVSMKVADRKLLTGSVPKSKLIICEIVVNISKCNMLFSSTSYGINMNSGTVLRDMVNSFIPPKLGR